MSESVAGATRGGVFRAVPGAFPVGALTAAAGALGAAAVILLSTYKLPMILCYFKLVTGHPCLTCGGTRAAVRLLRLDPAGALTMNPLVTVAGLLVAAWGVADLVLLTRGRALRVELGPGAARVLRIALPLAVVANWIYLIAVGR
jgi:hypothetical protein